MATINEVLKNAQKIAAQAAALGVDLAAEKIRALEESLAVRVAAGVAPGEVVHNSKTMSRAIYTQDAKDWHDIRMCQVVFAAEKGQARIADFGDLMAAKGSATIAFPHWKTRRVPGVDKPLTIPGGRVFKFDLPGGGVPESVSLAERLPDGSLVKDVGAMTFKPLVDGWFVGRSRKVFSDRFWDLSLRLDFATGEGFGVPIYRTRMAKQAASDEAGRVVIHGIGIDLRYVHLNADRDHGFRMSYVDLLPENPPAAPAEPPKPAPVVLQELPEEVKKADAALGPLKKTAKKPAKKSAKKPAPPVSSEEDDPSDNEFGF
jgi:hypothetical protein